MAAGKLADQKRTLITWKVTAQIGFEPGQVKFLSGSNGRRMVEQVAHLSASLAIGQHRRIVEMCVTIKTTKRKPLPGIKEFAPGRVPRHPAHIYCALRRE